MKKVRLFSFLALATFIFVIVRMNSCHNEKLQGQYIPSQEHIEAKKPAVESDTVTEIVTDIRGRHVETHPRTTTTVTKSTTVVPPITNTLPTYKGWHGPSEEGDRYWYTYIGGPETEKIDCSTQAIEWSIGGQVTYLIDNLKGKEEKVKGISGYRFLLQEDNVTWKSIPEDQFRTMMANAQAVGFLPDNPNKFVGKIGFKK